ncbi:periplasmic sugar-binding protein of ABC transporter [Spirochaetia bacterium]|nr:periplasmic sugar-binding protein of ABC transporter [Spirochaetia bacterium]
MKKGVIFAIVVSLLFAEAGSVFAAGGGEKGAKKLTIAGMVYQDDEFMNDLILGMKAAAVEEDINLLTSNVNGDQSREVELINTYVDQKVDGICIAPMDPNTSIATLRNAAAKGVKITTVNMQLSNVDFLSGGYCSDDYTNGHLVGEDAVKWIKARNYNRPVKFALLHYDTQNPVQSGARYGGFFDALKEAGIQYTIVAKQPGEQIDLALAAATDIMTAHPDIDLFFCSHGLSMLGAVSAVAQSGNAGKYFVFGYDVNQLVAEMILSDENILQASIAQDPYVQGYNAIKQLVKVIRGEQKAFGDAVIVPGIVLSKNDPNNIISFLKSKYNVTYKR